MIRYGHNSITGILPAIVLEIAGREYIVNYIYLNQCMIDNTNKDNFLGSKYDTEYNNHYDNVISRCELNLDEVILFVGSGSESANVVFGDEFFTEYSSALENLLLDLENHVKTAYYDYPESCGKVTDGYFDRCISEVSTILENLKVLRHIFNRTSREKGLKIESLNLDVTLTYAEDGSGNPEDGILIETTIGTRYAASWISSFCNEPERLRLNLELLVHNDLDNFDFYFIDDLKDSYIRFERTKEDSNIFIIRVIPATASMPIIGVCLINEFIQQLYEGLLSCALQIGSPASAYEVERYDVKTKTYNYIGRASMYNKLKSPIIERYLALGCDNFYLYNDDKPLMRDQEVKHILKIGYDYSIVILTLEDYGPTFEVAENDTIYLTDSAKNEICTIVVPGLYKWQQKFANKSDGVKSKIGTIDTEQWHKQGLEFAIEIRKQLPRNCDLWYGYSFEDVDNRGSRPELVYMPIEDERGY
jgi:hypothetical protein